MSKLSGVPILILKEGTERKQGRNAQKNNIAAAKAVTEAVKTTLGPKGMDKMLVDSLGDVTITNDGATILDTIDVEHPAAKMIIEVAKTQDDKVGDGTTTSVIIAGELLNLAEELMDQQVHPTIIFRGYRKALVKSKEILKNLATKIDINDKSTLIKVAETSMNSKLIAGAKSHFADIAVNGVSQIMEDRGDYKIVDLDQIQIIKKEGKSLLDTSIIDGIIVDKEVVHPMMPKSIKDAKIALISSALEEQTIIQQGLIVVAGYILSLAHAFQAVGKDIVQDNCFGGQGHSMIAAIERIVVHDDIFNHIRAFVVLIRMLVGHHANT